MSKGSAEALEDGGNQSGIPTVNGSLVFDERYLGKPLVYCGSIGILPAHILGRATHLKEILPGDLIVIAGGRTGKDGIHGATFSSEALHAGSPSTAVQIGDPFTQKKLHDFLLEARDAGLYRTLTDNGAGGFLLPWENWPIYPAAVRSIGSRAAQTTKSCSMGNPSQRISRAHDFGRAAVSLKRIDRAGGAARGGAVLSRHVHR